MPRRIPLIALLVTALVAPWTAYASALDHDAALLAVDAYLDRQMDRFAPTPADYPAGFAGAQLIQSYDVPQTDPSFATTYHRADVYDTALAAIYYTRRGDTARAGRLLDGIRFVQHIDPIKDPGDPTTGDGRLRAAYYANDLLAPNRVSPSITSPEAGVGNMAWAGIALTSYYGQTQQQSYLDAAVRIGEWIDSHTRQSDADGFGGYSLGEDGAGNLLFNAQARGTEHNTDVFTLGRNLFLLDRDPVTGAGKAQWSQMADHAAGFVAAVYEPIDGKYWTGTQQGAGGQIEIAQSPVPADTQTWTALAGLDDPVRAAASIRFLVDTPVSDPDHLLVTDDMSALFPGDPRTFRGTRFTNQGAHVQSENTAGAAMAAAVGVREGWLTEQGGEPAGKWAGEVQALLESLDAIRTDAEGADPNGLGVVATPWPAGAPTGFNFDYPNLRHTAAAAWLGLALLVDHPDPLVRDAAANPLRPLAALLLLGDADNDGAVTADDLVAVQQNFGAAGPNGDGTDPGDADDDGVVTADDLVSVQQNFGNVLAGAAAGPVPEPSTIALICACGLAALGRPSTRRAR